MPGIVSYQFLDKNGNVLCSQNPQTLIMPASNMKLVSGFSAYRLLGSDYVFKTTFSVKGDKLIVSGDPTFLLDGPKLLEIGNTISESNCEIREIILDTSSLDFLPYGSGWMIEDRKYTYQARIAPFSVNEGSVHAGDHELEKLIDPHMESLKPVQNQLRHFSQSLWKAIGLSGKAKYSIGSETGGKLLFTYSVSIKDVIKHIEEVSCNFSIEVLTKLISFKMDGKKGTWKRSIKCIYKAMKEMNLDTSEIRIQDGSGLSRLNLLTTDFLSNLVLQIAKSDEKEFLKLLPSPGSGTLKERLPELKESGMHAKTGSIAYCSSLTGYIEKLGVSFSIAINHSPEPDNLLPKMVDEILLGEIRALGL